jgi:hypothetical protein
MPMFGGAYNGGGAAPMSPWGALKNAWATPAFSGGGAPGQGSAYGALGGIGQQFMGMGQPRFAGAQPQPQPRPEGMFPWMQQQPSGGGMFGAGVPQGGAGQLPPSLLALLQQQLGPTSQAGWGLGTTTTSTPSRWGSPSNMIGSFFNPGGYR